LRIDDDGNIGLGISLPQTELHVTGKVGKPEIRCETFGTTPYVWQLGRAMTDQRKALACWKEMVKFYEKPVSNQGFSPCQTPPAP
jgi:hypothetical protein